MRRLAHEYDANAARSAIGVELVGEEFQQQEFQMPARFAPILFGFILSGLMSLLVSGIATFRNAGLVDGFFGIWVNAPAARAK